MALPGLTVTLFAVCLSSALGKRTGALKPSPARPGLWVSVGSSSARLGPATARRSLRSPAWEGFQRTFMEVIIPQRIPLHATGNMRDCYYQGYVADYTDSLVMLSTCSGLRGLLQFSNTSYGIEPMKSAHGFQHLVYQIIYDSSHPISANDYYIKWSTELLQKISIGIPANFSTQRYLEMHVVVSKALYEHLGSKVDAVTEKIIQLGNFINTMFFKLNTQVLLSSLEIWTDKDKVHTTRSMNELLHRFTEWKHSHLSLRPHDAAFLFIYKEQSESVGAAFARKLCIRPTSAAVAVYKKEYTLENFSVIVAQLLAISLGIYFDRPSGCHCPGSACLMHTQAV